MTVLENVFAEYSVFTQLKLMYFPTLLQDDIEH